MSTVFDRQVAAYDGWKKNLIRQIIQFRRWMESHQLDFDEGITRINRALQILKNDHITLAFVGEFSRGKTELVNGLFYQQLGLRLLPSEPGRTTMCPTELYYERGAASCAVRLLPIETRRTAANLDSFKRIPNKWVRFEFDPRREEEMGRIMQQVAATKEVSPEDAELLGFDCTRLQRNATGNVLIPRWRHALINLDHPLLRSGLRIIDTPGLNALGSEPELTLNTLPNANAVMFMLSADTGVSASDHNTWEHHIQPLIRESACSVFAVLNKIDVLWDALDGEKKSTRQIETMRTETAKQLDLNVNEVIPVSAREGLAAKVTEDSALYAKSRFVDLEELLSKRVLLQQESLLENSVINDVIAMMHDSQNTVKERLFEMEAQYANIAAIHSDLDAQHREIESMRETVKAEHALFRRKLMSIKYSRRSLAQQGAKLRLPINNHLLNKQFEATQESLEKRWTTFGLSKVMEQFFDDIEGNLEQVDQEVRVANKLLKAIYRRYDDTSVQHSEHRNQLDIEVHHIAFARLKKQAHRLRGDLKMLISNKNTVIQNFYDTIVTAALELYKQLNHSIDIWVREALVPLIQHSLYQKQLLEHHVSQLNSKTSKVKASAVHLDNLKKNIGELEGSLIQLNDLIEAIHPPTSIKSNSNVLSLHQQA